MRTTIAMALLAFSLNTFAEVTNYKILKKNECIYAIHRGVKKLICNSNVTKYGAMKVLDDHYGGDYYRPNQDRVSTRRAKSVTEDYYLPKNYTETSNGWRTYKRNRRISKSIAEDYYLPQNYQDHDYRPNAIRIREEQKRKKAYETNLAKKLEKLSQEENN